MMPPTEQIWVQPPMDGIDPDQSSGFTGVPFNYAPAPAAVDVALARSRGKCARSIVKGGQMPDVIANAIYLILVPGWCSKRQ